MDEKSTVFCYSMFLQIGWPLEVGPCCLECGDLTNGSEYCGKTSCRLSDKLVGYLTGEDMLKEYKENNEKENERLKDFHCVHFEEGLLMLEKGPWENLAALDICMPPSPLGNLVVCRTRKHLYEVRADDNGDLSVRFSTNLRQVNDYVCYSPMIYLDKWGFCFVVLCENGNLLLHRGFNENDILLLVIEAVPARAREKAKLYVDNTEGLMLSYYDSEEKKSIRWHLKNTSRITVGGER
tara:strand:- start:151 stop:864 length:714 start_codon:yes stop_codon:yes gene_type:complete